MATWYVTPCPVCDSIIDFCGAQPEQKVECPECAEVFKIVSLDPLKLVYAFDLNHEAEFYDEDYPRS